MADTGRRHPRREPDAAAPVQLRLPLCEHPMTHRWQAKCLICGTTIRPVDHPRRAA